MGATADIFKSNVFLYFYYVKPKLTWLKLHQELWLVKVEKEQIRNGFCYSMTHRLSVIQY